MKAIHKETLTPLFARKWKKRAHAYLVWDAKQGGLALSVRPSGSMAWKVIYAFEGRTRWLTLGATDRIGLSDARRLAARALLQVIEGRDPAAEKKAKRGAGTFRELAHRYVSEYAQRRNKSWRQADALTRKYLIPHWGPMRVKNITRAEVRSLISRIARPVLANQVLAAASAIFAWATKMEIIPFNPCVGVERNATVTRERILSDSEVATLWAAFADCGFVQCCAFKVLLLCGQRPGEVTHMRWEHLDGEWWTMPGAPVPELGWLGTKNAHTHRVYLPEPVRAILDEVSDGERSSRGWVFPGARSAPIGQLAPHMRRLCSTLGIPRATPHDLRRTHGSTITRLGFGRSAMNRVQNHREGGISDVYDRHSYAEENKVVMESVAAHLIALASGAPPTAKVIPLRG